MAVNIPDLGTLNRALTAVSITNFPDLNITTGYFSTKMASTTFDGDASDYIPVAAGAVPSGRLYQIVTITIYINKSQGLAYLWEQQRLNTTNLGPVTFICDSSVMPEYDLANCTLQNISSVSGNGEDNDFPITIRGTYYINNSLWGN